jgi:protein gp37
VKVSPGCKHCYAERFAERFRGVPDHPYEAGFDPTLRPDRLGQPRTWRTPRMVFVNSMSDMFGDFVPDECSMSTGTRTAAKTLRQSTELLRHRPELPVGVIDDNVSRLYLRVAVRQKHYIDGAVPLGPQRSFPDESLKLATI